MKKIFISIAIALVCLTASGQSLQRNGNTFSAPKTEKVKTPKEEQKVDAQWQDKDGTYQLYIGAKGGLYYYKTAKSGKHAGELQKRYLPKEKSEEIKRAIGIKS